MIRTAIRREGNTGRFLIRYGIGPAFSCRQRRDAIVRGINGIEGLSARTPEGAFYLFVNIRATGLSSEEFAMRLLKEGRVALSPGSAFGPSGEGYVRISYACSLQTIEEGVRRIARFVATLKPHA